MRLELRGLAETVDFASTDRVSLYRHEADGFTLLGRYSARPGFEGLGREVLPVGEGVLGDAWEHGRAEQTSLPSSGPEGGAPTQQWLRAQGRLGLDQATASALSMRTQAYAAFRIGTPDEEKLGALVFESTLNGAQLQAKGRVPELSVAGLSEAAKGATRRLAALILASRVIERPEVREILTAERGG